VKVSFENIDDDVIFRISDFELKYERILKMCFYTNDGKGYTKRYPADAKYLAKMQERYAQKARLMFDQLGYFTEIPWEKGLEKFCEIMEGQNIDWWLTGSCAACIRGVRLNPHDIDIMINSADKDKITELFSDYLIEPIIDTNGWVTKDFGVMFLEVRIDIASDPSPLIDQPEPADCGPYARNHLEIIEWNGYKIQVPPLQLQLNVNRRRERFDRVKIIEEFIVQQKSKNK